MINSWSNINRDGGISFTSSKWNGTSTTTCVTANKYRKPI